MHYATIPLSFFYIWKIKTSLWFILYYQYALRKIYKIIKIKWNKVKMKLWK